jgi:hypothetical protein
MALPARSNGPHREWFIDARDSGRRMEVSWHKDERFLIVSLWQGSICRATFRMPVEQAPSAIKVFADALGDAATNPVDIANRPSRLSYRSMIERFRQWFRRRRAEAVRLDRRTL